MAQPQTDSKLLGFPDARRLVEGEARRLRAPGIEQASLLASAGRILATDLLADRDFPPFHRSTRDGFAVRSADVQNPTVTLRVIGEIRAGTAAPLNTSINSGETMEIMTGAPLPEGADAVVMVEYTARDGESVTVNRSVSSEENVVLRGTEAKAGAVLLRAGTRMDYAAIAAASAIGKVSLDVFRKPQVYILSTGDEVVDIARQPGPHQIRNSNTYSIAAQVAAAGGEPVMLPVSPDDPNYMRGLIREGLQGDMLLLSGGVSMGKYDLVETVLAEFDANFHFTGVLIQPGKPLVFGDASVDGERKCFFGLPGNPVSTMVTFELFVRPVLKALTGARPGNLVFPLARLRGTIRSKTGLTRFIPAVLCGRYGEPEIELAGWHGSGDIAAAARANCFAVVGPEVTELNEGELIPVLLRDLEI